MNIEQMTQKTREALQAAQRIAVEYSNNAVEQEHLLAALAQQQDGLIPQMLQTLGVDAKCLCQCGFAEGRGSAPRDWAPGRDPEKIYISGDLDRALNAAEQQAKQMKDEYISVEHVFLGILQRTAMLPAKFSRLLASRLRNLCRRSAQCVAISG